jgi:phospho-N-acetylmuramoyl-pentapeptide-transferase
MDFFIVVMPVMGWAFARYTLAFLKSFGMKQTVRDDGPQSHLVKQGTPTMGGVYFIFIWLVSYFIITSFSTNILSGHAVLAMMSLFLCFACIGCYDDLCKIHAKKGIHMLPKFALQCIAAMVWSLLYMNHHAIFVPGIGDFTLSPLWSCIWSSLVIVGTANAVNLTDGLDGLMIQTVGIVLCGFMVIAVQLHALSLQWVIMILLSMLLALWPLNSYPAKLFLGDTGSLAMGSALAGLALFLHAELALILMGLVFVLETCSVAIQIIVFKCTGKRFFKMAPIHHHFELCGWSEKKIVAYLSVLTVLTTSLGVIWCMQR